eukprot:5758351-Pleurochrysis_carterae.AAC.4
MVKLRATEGEDKTRKRIGAVTGMSTLPRSVPALAKFLRTAHSRASQMHLEVYVPPDATLSHHVTAHGAYDGKTLQRRPVVAPRSSAGC